MVSITYECLSFFVSSILLFVDWQGVVSEPGTKAHRLTAAVVLRELVHSVPADGPEKFR